jgi:hypothetical protein
MEIQYILWQNFHMLDEQKEPQIKGSVVLVVSRLFVKKWKLVS